MIFLAYALVSWLVGAFSIDWRRWRRGYPTALAGALGSCVLDLSGLGHGGWWTYHSRWLPGLWPNLVLNLSLYPVGAWTFAQRLPRRGGRLFLWGLLGEAVLVAEEAGLWLSGHLSYRNGWGIGWSALLNVGLLAGLLAHARWAEGLWARR
ncbi:MAG: hypothetical protein K6U14_05620 [Firmicutes bacterium]|nr:hypothetical protein [Alicyclobacillaceae bacterium]MCL6497097.1 hypothetical protein [Bacillota bacterium]